MRDKDDLDLLLDSALATYADPGPDSTLEEHVLASLAAARAAEQERRPRWWLGWAIAVPVTASLLLGIAVSRTLQSPTIQTGQERRTQTPHVDMPASGQRLAQQDRPPGAKAHPHVVAQAARLKPCPFKAADLGAAPPEGVQKCRSTRTQVANKAPLPKLDVFPAPQPLSPEEETLVDVAKNGTEAERHALTASDKHSDTPLSIAALNIPPLAPPDEGEN